MIIKKGTTDVTTYFKLIDPTTGAPVTGLTITDLDATYVRDGAAAVKADLTALAAVDSAHGDNKAIQIDATNCPGLYRVDWPDDAFLTGVNRVQLCVNGAAIDPAYVEVELVNYDPADGVRLGLTALPNAVPGAENGIFIAGSNAATSITSSSGSALTITSSGGNGCGIIVAGNGNGSGIKSTGGTSGHGIEAILGGGMGTYAIQCNTGSINTASLIGNIVGTISAVASVGAGGIASTSFATGAITAAAIAADAIGASELAADAATEIGTAVWATAARTLTAATNITSTGGTTVPQTGDSYARIGAAGASLSAIPWNAAWDAEVQSECEDAITAASLTAAGIADAVLDEAMSGHTSAGTLGKVVADILEDTGTTIPAAIAGVGGQAGAGAITFTYTVTDSSSGLPIADVDVWATSDTAGTNVLASGKTNSSGQVTMYLDAGTVYIFCQKSGYTFSNPDTETVA